MSTRRSAPLAIVPASPTQRVCVCSYGQRSFRLRKTETCSDRILLASFAGVGSSRSTEPSLMKLNSGRIAIDGRETFAAAEERLLDTLTLSSGLGDGTECDESAEVIVRGESAQGMSMSLRRGEWWSSLERSSGLNRIESLAGEL